MNDKKKLFAASAAYILGLTPNVKIKGNSTQLLALQEVLGSSRRLYLSLREEADNPDIAVMLETKTVAAKKFKESFGYNWPF